MRGERGRWEFSFLRCRLACEEGWTNRAILDLDLAPPSIIVSLIVLQDVTTSPLMHNDFAVIPRLLPHYDRCFIPTSLGRERSSLALWRSGIPQMYETCRSNYSAGGSSDLVAPSIIRIPASHGLRSTSAIKRAVWSKVDPGGFTVVSPDHRRSVNIRSDSTFAGETNYPT